MAGGRRPADVEEDEDEEENDRPGLLSLLGEGGSIAAAIATLGLLLAFLGWRTDTLPWLANNEPYWIAGAVLGFSLSVLLVVASIAPGHADDRRASLSHWAFGTLAVGIICAVIGGIRGWSHPEFPFFTNATFQAAPEGTRVTATLKGSRIDASDRVIFFVDTLRWRDDKQTFDVTHRRSDSFGPDAAGTINQPISTLVPPGDYRAVGLIAWVGKKADFQSAADCYNQGSRRQEISCVVLSLERVAEMPQLTSEWVEINGRELLRVTVSARYTESRPIIVSVTGLRSKGRRRELASFALEPDAVGRFERVVDLAVPALYDRVCVVARAGQGPVGCPHQPRRHARPETVWQVLSRHAAATGG